VPMLGIALGFASDSDWAPEWLGEVAVATLLGGVLVPLFIAAVLGGEAITRGGGIVGALLTFGIVAAAVGNTLERPGLMYAGCAALVVSVLGFFFMGWRAGVAMDVGGTPVGKRRPPKS